jgi:plasmid stability protein
MSVNLSVKDVPEGLAEAIREKARLNHRSLQGEMMAMIEAHVGGRPFQARKLLDAVRGLGLSTEDDSVAMIREDRDSR